jgi:hypothetical protein
VDNQAAQPAQLYYSATNKKGEIGFTEEVSARFAPGRFGLA